MGERTRIEQLWEKAQGWLAKRGIFVVLYGHVGDELAEQWANNQGGKFPVSEEQP